MTAHEPKPASRLPTLDGWRAIAILIVIFCHSGTELFGPHGLWRSDCLFWIAGEGRNGVDIFFALSGFLITTLMLRELSARGAVDLVGFYRRRAARILPPLMVLLAVLSLMAQARQWQPTRGEWLASLFMARNYVDGDYRTGHLWSLAVEEHFYLFWPLLLVWATRTRRPLWPVGALIVATIIWRWRVFSGHVPAMFLAGDDWMTSVHTDVRLDALLWGGVFAFVYADEARRARLRRWLAPTLWLLTIVAFIAADSLAPALRWSLKAALAPLIVLGPLLRPDGLVARALEWPPLRAIGVASYSLYLLQEAFIPFTPLALVEVGLLVVVVHFTVERPFQRWGRGGGVREPGVRQWSAAALALIVVAYGRVLGSAPVVRPPPPLPDGVAVTLFADVGFAGRQETFGPGRYSWNELRGLDRQASSTLVSDGARARLCDSSMNCRDLEPGSRVDYLADLNDRASMLFVGVR